MFKNIFGDQSYQEAALLNYN